MTLPLVKPAGWDDEDLLTSDEMNLLQALLVRALDGQDGGTYELDDDLIFDGAGAVVIANDLQVQSGATATIAGTMDVTGTLDVESTGALNVRTGGELNVKTGAVVTYESGSQEVIASGASSHVSGDLDVENGGDLTLKNGADQIVASGGEIAVQAGGLLNIAGDANIQSGGEQTVLSGGQLTVAAGGIIQMATPDLLTINASGFSFRLGGTAVFAATGWSSTSEGNWDMTADSGQLLTLALPLHVGDSLTSVSMRLSGSGMGNGGHASIAGMDMPEIQVIRKDVNGNVVVAGTQVDTSANAAAYDAAHTVTLSLGPGLSIGLNETYYVRLRAEGPTNSIANRTRVYMITGTGLARSYRGSNEIYA